MKSSVTLSAGELSDLVASVLEYNGRPATGPLALYLNGQPVEFDEARIDVLMAGLEVRVAAEDSDPMAQARRRYEEFLQRGMRGLVREEDAGDEAE